MSRSLKYGFLVALALGGVLLYLLAAAAGNTATFEQHYPTLLAINGVVALSLAVLVVLLVARLVRRLRQRRFGARLMARFAIAFALVGVLPGMLIYVVSVQFLSRSIESWFDVRVDRALESGLTLGRAALEAQLADLNAKGRAIALELADVPDNGQLAALDRARERAGVHEALLVTASGTLVGTSSARGTALAPDMPSPTALRQARTQRSVAVIEGDPLSTDPRLGLRTRVIVPIPLPTAAERSVLPTTSLRLPFALREPAPEPGVRGERRFLQLVQQVPPSVAANAQALQDGYREYQELSLARSGLRKIYTLTLTLTLLLAVFAAMASAVLLASSMTAPLLHVAEGTRAVAEGDYRRRVREFRGNDELNVLARSFNAMTAQLGAARDAVEVKQRELENAKAYLERVLANLSAGVIVANHDWKLVTANYGASRILGLPLAPRVGEALGDLVPVLAAKLAGAFEDQALSATPKDSWQQQLEVPRAGSVPGAEPLALLARGSRLPLDDGPGYVVVFDDITQVISAQRAVAWGEVARRLAHEIKNPLTPIQLAAERLQMKLSPRLPPEQADVLMRGASTIVSQVAAMKRMVDDFRDYARVPPARLAPLELNALIEEVAALYGTAGATVELKLAAALPPILGDAGQLRQVIHNLIANAQEAIGAARAARGADAPEAADPPRIVVRTEPVRVDEGAGPAQAAGATGVRFAVEDNGPGFPTNILRRAFEPYVTTKPSGTGLGLAMVKKIVDEHGARIELVNRHVGSPGGATVTIVFRRLAPAADAAGTPTDEAARRVA
jgi:nitrogen fixation/metabolism regulation signal transduction histidine kinase